MSDRYPVPFEHGGLLPIVLLLLLGTSSVGAAVTSLEPPEPLAPTAATPPTTPTTPTTPKAATPTEAPAAAPSPTPSPAASPAPSPIASASASAQPKADGPCAPRISVLFSSGEPQPPVGAAKRLGALVKLLSDHPDLTLTVNGHADSTGSDDKNIALSHRRAKAVAKLLEDAGVGHARMTVRGFGAFQPLEGSDEAAPDNRRVILRVRGMPSCEQVPEEVIAP